MGLASLRRKQSVLLEGAKPIPVSIEIGPLLKLGRRRLDLKDNNRSKPTQNAALSARLVAKGNLPQEELPLMTPTRLSA